MASITKSTGRLLWALSLLGLDRLAGFFGSTSPWDHPEHGQVQNSATVFDTVTETVRSLVRPSFQSMIDVGDRVLGRFFGSLDDLAEEDDVPWPFPAEETEPREPYAEGPVEPNDDPVYASPFDEAVSAPDGVSKPVSSSDSSDGSGAWGPIPNLPDIGDFFGGDL